MTKEMKHLDVGETVQLLSGGPVMMVTSFGDQSDDIIHCEWFVGAELKRDAFDVVNLTVWRIPSLVPRIPSVWDGELEKPQVHNG